MIALKLAVFVLLLNIVFAVNDYGSNSSPYEIMEIQQNDKRTIQGITRMLRDPGWRHIGLGKRSYGKAYTGKTWAMIGLGR
uniref:Uncharacterized protein n=1 Tax=Panagrolaimus sp. ES5 TaxID=591445 RepID=A0AC34GP58_9BILA